MLREYEALSRRGEPFYGARLTGRCFVTARQYAACLGGPFLTLSAPNTFFPFTLYTLVLLNYA